MEESAGNSPHSISHCTEVAGKLARLLLLGSHSDVTFLVGGEKFQAHRLILALQSEYFNRLLYGHMREATPGAVVAMENTSADAFRLLLQYAYCGTISMAAEEIELALELLELADMCGLMQLKEALGDLIIQKMATPQNLLLASLHLDLHGATVAHTQCLKAMDDHAPKVLASEAFHQLSRHHLHQILSRDSFFASEAAILHAVGRWLHSNNEMPDDVRNEALLSCVRVTQIDPTAVEREDTTLFLTVKNMKSSKCIQWNETPRGKLENEDLLHCFETIGPADRTLTTRNALADKTNLPASEKPWLTQEVLNSASNPSVAIFVAFKEQYLISSFQFHCYHSHQHKGRTEAGPTICYKPFSYRLEASTDVLPLQWKCIADYSGFSCHGKQQIYFPPMGIKYARLVVTSHSCESAHKWSMEPLQRDSRKDMEPRPNGMMAPLSMVTPRYRLLSCLYECNRLPNDLRATFVLGLSQPYVLSSISVKLTSSVDCRGDLTILTSTQEAKGSYEEAGVARQQYIGTENEVTIHFPEKVVLFISLEIQSIQCIPSEQEGRSYPVIAVETITCCTSSLQPQCTDIAL